MQTGVIDCLRQWFITISFGTLEGYSQKEAFMNSTPEYRAKFQTDWFQKELDFNSNKN